MIDLLNCYFSFSCNLSLSEFVVFISSAVLLVFKLRCRIHLEYKEDTPKKSFLLGMKGTHNAQCSVLSDHFSFFLFFFC